MMHGTIEVWELASRLLVYSDGYAPTVQPAAPNTAVDYIVVRRYGPRTVPRAAILTFILNEFLHWHLQSTPSTEAFTDISSEELHFLQGSTLP
jgi:hypothetical protein